MKTTLEIEELDRVVKFLDALNTIVNRHQIGIAPDGDYLRLVVDRKQVPLTIECDENDRLYAVVSV